jgi:enoyl-CoA hydratase/carnithine racemase
MRSGSRAESSFLKEVAAFLAGNTQTMVASPTATATTTRLFDDNGVTLSEACNGVLTLVMDRGPNVVNPVLISSLSKAISVAEQHDHPKALVVTAVGKFFCNGLDLEYMQRGPENAKAMIESFWRLLARILVLDCRTVAALNGHAFGAGLFLGLACDFRVMRTQKGYLNFPELNLGMRLAKGFAELTKAKTSPLVWREGVLTGKRYSSEDACKAGLIDHECDIHGLMQRANEIAVVGFAENLPARFFDAENFRVMKIELYTDAYRALTLGAVESLPQSRL